MFAAPEEVAMHRQLEKDPTEFFSVVGAPYVRERVRESHIGEYLHNGTAAPKPRQRQPKIRFATLCAVLGAFVLGMFATSVTARLSEVAYQTAATK
jgi:hypothetical protein